MMFARIDPEGPPDTTGGIVGCRFADHRVDKAVAAADPTPAARSGRCSEVSHP